MKAHILIIDDDQKLLDLLTRYLSNFGFTISTADHPDEGMKKLRQSAPDLIVLDIMLPDSDGFEVC